MAHAELARQTRSGSLRRELVPSVPLCKVVNSAEAAKAAKAAKESAEGGEKERRKGGEAEAAGVFIRWREREEEGKRGKPHRQRERKPTAMRGRRAKCA